MNIVLLLVAVILKAALSPALVVYNLLRCLWIGGKAGYKNGGIKGLFMGMYGELNDWCWDLACVIDQLGNVLGKYSWDDMFRKKDQGYPAGDRLDTISYFLGANKYKGTLTKTGEFLSDDVLDRFESDHALRAYHNCNEGIKNKIMNL